MKYFFRKWLKRHYKDKIGDKSKWSEWNKDYFINYDIIYKLYWYIDLDVIITVPLGGEYSLYLGVM